jgi:uncharacterized ferritin-like protein (DUF455 family)
MADESSRDDPMNALSEAVRACLVEPDPAQKRVRIGGVRAAIAAGELLPDGDRTVVPVDDPGRPAAPILVHPREVPQRRLTDEQGHAAFLHAVAHIEFTAMNLALDAAHRFRGMPDSYYEDWLAVAEEEGIHFALLSDYLEELGFRYGDFAAHGAMWQMALATREDVLERMAIVPRGLEARGLDVTPGMIERLEAFGDPKGAGILRRIFTDEIGHVGVGTRWFNWCCSARGLDAPQQFMACMARHLGTVRLPKPHLVARRQAGFSELELELLRGWLHSR